ncbi:uncharacterized protein BDV14DRAFT_180000 [Aspergillus stella-maris]|uniref:uncharacterized protein n=1 Tax=Aspergillus stella-maris TaxID=1810926 RepID=UPI003CCCA4AC
MHRMPNNLYSITTALAKASAGRHSRPGGSSETTSNLNCSHPTHLNPSSLKDTQGWTATLSSVFGAAPGRAQWSTPRDRHLQSLPRWPSLKVSGFRRK